MERNETPMDMAGSDAASRETRGTGEKTGFRINVGKPERWISAAIGGGLLFYGIRRRSWAGTMTALAGGNLLLRGAMGRSFIYQAFGINTASKADAVKQAMGTGVFKADKSVSIDRPVEDVYRFWRNFENLPRVMRHLKEVRNIDDRKSHWVAKAPAGIGIEWDAEITEDAENRMIAWRSLDSSEIKNNGAVEFAQIPGGQSTRLRAIIEYEMPAGKLGKAFAKLLGKDPEVMIEDDLRRFKQLMETGEAAYAS